MKTKEILAHGITAKHAAELVKIANSFKSEILISADNKKVNAKSLMGVIALGLKTQKNIKITADGADEAAAAEALAKFFMSV